jgi:signal transduction histidine kinase/DNA-binding response OmpR family regulator
MSNTMLANIPLTDIINYLVSGIGLLGCVSALGIYISCKKRKEVNEECNEALRQLEQIKQLPKNNPNPVVCIDLDGKIILINPAATKQYPDIEKMRFDHPILGGLDELKEKAKKEPNVKHVLEREVNFGGFFYEQYISTIALNNNVILAIYSYDVTMYRISEKQLRITKDAADVANRAKSDFLANISHELRTPMNGIIGLSQLLLEMSQEEEQKELACAVTNSSRNLLILLNDILDLSKIEAGELTLERIPFDIRRTIHQTVDLLKPIASRKSVILDSIVSSTIPERIMGDPARLQQIINNLVSNAIKFTEEGYVRIDVNSGKNDLSEPEMHIYIEDTGIGIPKDKQEIIFQKFTQADVSTTRKYGGTGLGLSICKELVEKMGGTIGVDSIEGKGTTFYVKIPIEVATAKDDEGHHKEENKTAPINMEAKLLVVDDHPVNLLFMRKVLKKMGFQNADEASGGREAAEMAEKTKYDLIFMDCQMPDIDGFEASKIIRESEEKIGDIKIIAVTADAMKGAREKCLDSGMNDYISKPVDVEKLHDVLSIWLPANGNNNKKKSSSKNTGSDLDEKTKPSNNTCDRKSYSETYPNKDENMNDDIMDWDRLDLFTDGDPEEEKMLIDLFVTNAEETLSLIKEQICSDNNDEWEKATHRLKGSAANLGAKYLAEICAQAEKSSDENEETKRIIFRSIQSSYEDVYKALHKKIS